MQPKRKPVAHIPIRSLPEPLEEENQDGTGSPQFPWKTVVKTEVGK